MEKEKKIAKIPKIFTTAILDRELMKKYSIKIAEKEWKKNDTINLLLKNFFASSTINDGKIFTKNMGKAEKDGKLVGFHINSDLWKKLSIFVANERGSGNSIDKVDVLEEVIRRWIKE